MGKTNITRLTPDIMATMAIILGTARRADIPIAVVMTIDMRTVPMEEVR